MIIEHWTDDSGDAAILANNKDKYPWDGVPKFCCSIQGKNWTICMEKYYMHMGFGKYIPMK